MGSVSGPTILLAAKVKNALDIDPATEPGSNQDPGLVKVPYGSFYVGAVILMYGDGRDLHEPVGYLTPDEADGGTFDFYPVEDAWANKLIQEWLDTAKKYVKDDS